MFARLIDCNVDANENRFDKANGTLGAMLVWPTAELGRPSGKGVRRRSHATITSLSAASNPGRSDPRVFSPESFSRLLRRKSLPEIISDKVPLRPLS